MGHSLRISYTVSPEVCNAKMEIEKRPPLKKPTHAFYLSLSLSIYLSLSLYRIFALQCKVWYDRLANVAYCLFQSLKRESYYSDVRENMMQICATLTFFRGSVQWNSWNWNILQAAVICPIQLYSGKQDVANAFYFKR
jgi:hypothetical protein